MRVHTGMGTLMSIANEPSSARGWNELMTAVINEKGSKHDLMPFDRARDT